jgi:hypothetical protein
MNKPVIIFIALFFGCAAAKAQIDPDLLKQPLKDTVKQTLNMDAVYNRPFISVGKLPVSIGGYMEANWQHLATDGVSEGHQFQFRRLTLFIASAIGKRLKFLSEMEFEDGGKEISVEFAALDLELHPLLNVRGGMILNPIGAFNQNHDGNLPTVPFPLHKCCPPHGAMPVLAFMASSTKKTGCLGMKFFFPAASTIPL